MAATREPARSWRHAGTMRMSVGLRRAQCRQTAGRSMTKGSSSTISCSSTRVASARRKCAHPHSRRVAGAQPGSEHLRLKGAACSVHARRRGAGPDRARLRAARSRRLHGLRLANAEESVRRLLDRLDDGEFDYEMDNGAHVRVRIEIDKAGPFRDVRFHRDERSAAGQFQCAIFDRARRFALCRAHADRRFHPDE